MTAGAEEESRRRVERVRKMSIRRMILAGAALLAALAPLGAQQAWEQPELVAADHVYTLDYVTPHVRWAKPLPGGPIKALFFMNARSMGSREVAEMAQRLDLQFDVVYYERTGRQVDDGAAGMERALRLIREGADVFVFGGVDLEGLSREAQYYLLEQVIREGAGLVCVGRPPAIAFTDDRVSDELPDELIARFPLASLARGREMAAAFGLTDPTDAELARRILTRYRLGAGRALFIRLPGGEEALTPRMEFSFEALAEYEYWAGFAANAIRWAAGRDSAVTFTNRPPTPVMLHRDDLPGALSVAITSDLSDTVPLTVDCSLRRADGRRVKMGGRKVEVAQGQTGEVVVTTPKLPAGRHVMEVVITSPRGVEAFGAQTLDVTTTRGVESVALDRQFGEVGDTISGTVAMRGQQFGADETLVLRLRDAEDRVIARQERPAQAGQVPFSFRVPENCTILMRAEAALVDGDGEIDRTYATFKVPRRCRDQFNFVMWDYPRRALGYWGLRSLRDNGVTVILSGAVPPAEIAAVDLAYVPYTTRILDTVGEDGVMEPVCWNDEPAVTQHIQEIADRYHGAREHGVYAYSLGDENQTRGACAHPACLAAYREWLESRYRTIAALNASWDSDFGSFEEIGFFEPGDLNEQAALNAGHVARWYDRQAFRRYNYAVYCGRYARIYAAMDPLAITGFEGAGRLGDDYDAIIERVGLFAPYPSIGNDIIRSLAPRDELITANWMGYRRDPQPMAMRMWRMISDGFDGVWWWRWDGIGRFHGFLAPDWHPWDDTSGVIIDEMRDIRDGVGTLMQRMVMPHDGIGLLYSMPSVYADGVEPRRGGSIDRAHNAFLDATQDLGFQAHYLSDRTITEGDLTDGDERALILPYCRAISDEVATQIRDFVRDGGLLIADLQPGERDGHCKPRTAGVLDDVFGVVQTPSGATPSPLQMATIDIAPTIGGTRAPVALETRIDPALRVTDGDALAEHEGTPLVIVNRFGAGTAVLLNFSIEGYDGLRQDMAEMPLRGLLGAIYALAGIEPPYRQSAGGGPLRWTETVRWEAPGLTIIGLFRNAGEDGPATTVLPAARHVYDLRNDRYLGETDRISGELRVGYANLYALTDRPIGEPVLEVRGDAVVPGETVECVARMRGRPQGLLPVRVRVFRPDGTEETWPRRELIAEDGVARFELPVAFNAVPGTWRITAREVLSGQTAEAQMTVAAPPPAAER